MAVMGKEAVSGWRLAVRKKRVSSILPFATRVH
jgi:hypothetical protein